MNFTWTERSTTGFDRAQAAYDRQEPPEPCRICDGTCRVEVEAITDADGCLIYWPTINKPEVECSFCIDGVKQPDGDWEMQRHDSLHDLPR